MWRARVSIGTSRARFYLLDRRRYNGSPQQSFKRADPIRISPKVKDALPLIATQMLQDGLVGGLHHTVTDVSRREILDKYFAKCSTSEERHEAVVSYSFLSYVSRLSSTACENCLYPREKCVCKDVHQVSTTHNLWLFQHHGEYGRNNNTGSLLCLMAGAQRTIRGFREQQRIMLEHVKRNRDSTIVLFPTPSSTTIEDYMRDRSAAFGAGAENDPLTLILLDGTSRQAKNLNRFMPHAIPRVRLGNSRLRSWLDPIRRQTEDHRVCTAQAAALVLRDLGDHHTSDSIEHAVERVVQLANQKHR